MKKIFTITILLLCLTLKITAQEPSARPGQPIGGIIVKGGKNPGGNMLLSLGGGITSSGTSIKENAHISNGMAFNGNLYVPLFAKGNGGLAGTTDHFFTIGFNVGGEYFGSNKDYSTSGYSPYNIAGQSGSPSVAVKGTGSPKTQGFKAEGGAQANFSIGKLTISPILNLGYINIDQKAFTITQSSAVNGKNYDYNLYGQAQTKTSSFMIVPKLRFAYFPGKLGLFVEGNYTMGPTIKNETSMFVPQGSMDASGFYKIDQMLMGSNSLQTKSSSYNSLGFNIGISLPLGKGITEKGIKRGIAEPEGKGITEKGIKRGIEEPQAKGLLESNQPAARGKLRGKVTKPSDGGVINRLANEDDGYRKDTAFLNGLFIEKEGQKVLNPKLFTQVTKDSELKGMKVYFKKAHKVYKYLGNQERVVQILTTANRPKECVDCTTRECNGVVYQCSCVNGFCYCILCVDITRLSELAE